MPLIVQDALTLPVVIATDEVTIHRGTRSYAAPVSSLSAISTSVLVGATAIPATPTDTSINHVYFNTATSQITHTWNSVTATWTPITGTFPIIKKCDGTNATAADLFITLDKITTAVAGAPSAANHIMVFPDAGGCPTKLQVPITCTTALPAPVGGGVLGVIDAAGNVGLTRPIMDRDRVVLGGAATINLLTTDTYIYNAAASGTITVPTPTAGDFCQANRVTIKRTSNDPLVTVRVTAAAGIDGAPGNTIQLGTSSAYGIQSGESVTLIYDGTTWRVI